MPRVEWHELIDCCLSVDAEDTLEQVYQRFSTLDANFMAVTVGSQTIGLCARHEIGMKLGSQYGYSLFARDAIRQHLLKNPVLIRVDQPWSDVLQQVFSRPRDSFGHDSVLVDATGHLLGLISTVTLVQLQTRLLMHSIDELRGRQQEIIRHNRQLTDNLKIAREMQLAMLPQSPPTLVVGSGQGYRRASVHAHYAPLNLVSGDFYEVLVLSETRLCVLVADVMGHGVQAALVTSMLRALIQDHRDIARHPGEFLCVLNRSLCHLLQDNHLTLFASAFAVVLDLSEGHLHYANAGHPPPILLQPGSGTGWHICNENQANGGLLGILNTAHFPAAVVTLGKHDRILLYSDGLFEVRDSENRMLGQDGLLQLACRYGEQNAPSMTRGILDDLAAYSHNGSFEDDVCLIVVDTELQETR